MHATPKDQRKQKKAKMLKRPLRLGTAHGHLFLEYVPVPCEKGRRAETVTECRYCGQPLPQDKRDEGSTFCTKCGHKKPHVRRFVEACAELKKRINYDTEEARR